MENGRSKGFVVSSVGRERSCLCPIPSNLEVRHA